MTSIETSSFFITPTATIEPDGLQFYQDWLHRLPPTTEQVSATTLHSIDPMTIVEACAVAAPHENQYHLAIPQFNPALGKPERIDLLLSAEQMYRLDRYCRQALVDTNRMAFMYKRPYMVQYPDRQLAIKNSLLKNGLIEFPVGTDRITIGYREDEGGSLASYNGSNDSIIFTSNFMKRYWQHDESQAMPPDTLLRWIAKHELTHRQWGLLSAEESLTIITQFHQRNPSVQTFLDRFMDKAVYREHAVPAQEPLEKNECLGHSYLTTYHDQLYRVNRSIVVDEMIAQASWADVLSAEELRTHALSQPHIETQKTVCMALAARNCIDQTPGMSHFLYSYGLLGNKGFEQSIASLRTAVQILGQEEGYEDYEGKSAFLQALFPSE